MDPEEELARTELDSYVAYVYSVARGAHLPATTVRACYTNTEDRRGRPKPMSEWIPGVRSFWRVSEKRRVSEAAGINDMSWLGMDAHDGGLYIVAEGSPAAGITPYSPPYYSGPGSPVGAIKAGCAQLIAETEARLARESTLAEHRDAAEDHMTEVETLVLED